MRIFMICIIPHQPFSGDEIKKNESGRACSTYGGRRTYSVLVGNRRERDHLKDRKLDGWIRVKCTITSGVGTWITFFWLRIGTDGRLLCKW
jgi:hypothetical protein